LDLVTLAMLGMLGTNASPAHVLPVHHAPLLIRTSDDGGGLKAAAAATGDEHGTSSAIDQWQPFITEASRRFGLPEAWVLAVMRVESGGRAIVDDRPIVSPAGAMGLMQVMPDTYAEMRLRHGLGADPFDPHDNILAGAAYLRAMYERYGYPGLFAAYNAGPDRYDAYRLHGATLPEETWSYLAAIGSGVKDGIRAQGPSGLPDPSRPDPANRSGIPSGTALFFALDRSARPLAPERNDAPSGLLFVPLRTNVEGSPPAEKSDE